MLALTPIFYARFALVWRSTLALAAQDFDKISEADISSLVASGMTENLSLEFKSGLYEPNDNGVKEFLKDISAFANTSGGHLVVGIEESQGVATKIVPLIGIDLDKEVLRFENLIRDCLEPRVFGVRMKAVKVGAGGVLVFRVPKSWNPPHRVVFKNSNRFFIRNSAGVHEAAVEELRVLFNASATALDKVRAFRRERLSKIQNDDTPIPLAKDLGGLVIHIAPMSAFSSTVSVDLNRVYKAQIELRPIGSDGFTPRLNFDGFINTRGNVPSYGYTQVFRNGCIEAVKVPALTKISGPLTIPWVVIEDAVIGSVSMYLNAMKSLDVSPPIVVMITLNGTQGALLQKNQSGFEDDPVPIVQASLELPEVLIEGFGTAHDYQRAIRPALDAMWNAGGYMGSPSYDIDGKWEIKRR